MIGWTSPAYDGDPARRSRTTHIESARTLPALRRPRVDAARHAHEEIRDRAAVALRVVQAHVHAGTGGTAQQDLSPAHHHRCAHDVQSRLLARETPRASKAKAGRTIATSTLSAWIAEHSDLMSYRRLRDAGRHRFPPEQTIRSIKLYHRQVYRYAFHRPKLELLRESVDDKRWDTASHRSPIFSKPSRSFARTSCFAAKQQPGAHRKPSRRSPMSGASSSIAKRMRRRARQRWSFQLSATIGAATRCLQKFMLANDSVTLAVEVPIWLTEDDIAALEKKYGIELVRRVGAAERHHRPHRFPAGAQRRGAHPGLQTGRAHQQTDRAARDLCARADARWCRVSKLFDIKCAWFNEEEYCEFFPRTLFTQKRG